MPTVSTYRVLLRGVARYGAATLGQLEHLTGKPGAGWGGGSARCPIKNSSACAQGQRLLPPATCVQCTPHPVR
eukprot:scaffold11310_cov107-Isochrysis_galbana.AAC.3